MGRYCNPDLVGQNVHNKRGIRIGMVSKGGWLTLTGEFNPEVDHDDLLDQGFTYDGDTEVMPDTEED